MNFGNSLFRHLLAWILATLFVVWAAFMYFGWRTGVHEADELTDGHLASVATLLLSQVEPGAKPASPASALGGVSELKAHDYQQSLSIVTWDSAGKLLSHSGEAPAPRFAEAEGFQTLELGAPAGAWRAFSRWNADHTRRVTVMLSVGERDELAADIAEQLAAPGLWLLPVAALVLGLALHRGLQPLVDLSDQVNRLDVHRDSALHAPPHEEFRAIVASIDMLMARYNAALARERELASEVAHELRTPLASLRLHASNLQHDLSPTELAEAKDRILVDAQRAAAVLTDVLALARASRTDLAEAVQPVDLADLSRRVAAGFAQLAVETGHELHVDAPASCPVNGHPVLLEVALRNLIENALAHTPRGSEVLVRVSIGPVAVEVSDNCADSANESHVTPPPHVGLGLGHQVVRRISEVHEARFEVGSTPAGQVYRIVFPPDSATI